MSSIANTPAAPYFAVIFSALKNDNINEEVYKNMAVEMHDLAQKSQGFLGFESAQEGLEISVSYWDSLDAIKIWSQNGFHQNAKKFGKEEIYSAYHVRITQVVREYKG